MGKIYYFLCYVRTFEVGRYDFIDTVCDIHPFIKIDELSKRKVESYERHYEYSIISYREISKDEYDLKLKLDSI
jgi:hypothetical protein